MLDHGHIASVRFDDSHVSFDVEQPPHGRSCKGREFTDRRHTYHHLMDNVRGDRIVMRAVHGSGPVGSETYHNPFLPPKTILNFGQK